MFFILGWILFGSLTGWLAAKIVNRRSEGCMINIALGLVGALVGGFIFRRLAGFSYDTAGFLTSMFVAVIGAVIVLLVYYALTGRRTVR